MPKKVDVTLYTRSECGLCDKAKAVIDQVISTESLEVEMHVIDVDSSPELRARYTNDVPVIEIGGVEAFRHRVDRAAFASRVREAAAGGQPAVAGELASKECVPCRGGVPPLAPDEVARLQEQISGAWTVVDGHHLSREYPFPDFKSALAFTNRVGQVAEDAGHHPDISVGWGYVRVAVWTHAIDGLTESDFILAARIDALGS